VCTTNDMFSVYRGNAVAIYPYFVVVVVVV
jgi:hypothetical protein